MSTPIPVVLELSEHEYGCLVAEAQRLGKTPGGLARDYLRNALGTGPMDVTAEQRERGLAALKGLAEIRARQPEGKPVDVVRVVRAGRQQLAKRSAR